MKKILILIISLVLVVSLAACSPKEAEAPVEPINPPAEEPAEEPVEEPVEDPAEEIVEEESVEVTLYFGNNEYILTGDEQYEYMLTEVQTITYGEICLEEAIVRALMDGPVDIDTLSTGFHENIVLNSVDVFDGVAYVDFSSEGLYGGSMQESYIISQVVESLTSLDTVDKVQFLVDGQEAESLMGHIDIRSPFEGVER